MSNTRGKPTTINEYWMKHYCTEHCTLCGNWGVIDSQGELTPSGHPVGRLNYCICPNGQAMRRDKVDLIDANKQRIRSMMVHLKEL